MAEEFDVVTGAFGQTGAAIAKQLIGQGRNVKSITRAPADPTGRIQVIPPSFQDPDALRNALTGCDTLYSTYWARFGIKGKFEPLVQNSRILFDAARDAGVRRVILTSVAKADADVDLPYWRGKAALEETLQDSGVEHRIIRPTLIFGPDDTLVNNAAWTMRHMPIMPVPGDAGDFRIRPVHIDDVAKLCVEAATASGPRITTTISPDAMTYLEFLHALRKATGANCAFPRLPQTMILAAAKAMRPILRDILVTRDELASLRYDLYDCDGDVNCPTSFNGWLAQHGAGLGNSYRSQMKRAEGKVYPGLAH